MSFEQYLRSKGYQDYWRKKIKGSWQDVSCTDDAYSSMDHRIYRTFKKDGCQSVTIGLGGIANGYGPTILTPYPNFLIGSLIYCNNSDDFYKPFIDGLTNEELYNAFVKGQNIPLYGDKADRFLQAWDNPKEYIRSRKP